MKVEVNTNTIYSIPGSVHKDNLTSGQIAFIFKGNITNHVCPWPSQNYLCNVQTWCYEGQSGIFDILILVDNT